jgi:CubicO group peptidase (beta-lactamase class C family)
MMIKKIALFLLAPLALWGQINRSALDGEIAAATAKGFNGVILVADHSKIMRHQAIGYRDYALKIPLKRSDIFELASVSKQFTAMIIMMLQEKELLGYDDPVSKYLAIPYPHITIRHLLTHTSGLPDYQAIMDQYWDKTKVASNKEILEYLNLYAPPRLFEPGARYEYSNTGYVLLASIAEKVSGRDFIELCREWIFRPLKMRHTDIRTLAEKKNLRNLAIGHLYIPERQTYLRADSFPSSNYTIWLGNRKGPGRISSTAQDLLKWDQALYRNKLVGSGTLEQAYTSMKLNNGSLSPYGFGWELGKMQDKNGRIVFHTGDNPGYATRIVRFLDKERTLILLSNNAYADMATFANALESIINEK